MNDHIDTPADNNQEPAATGSEIETIPPVNTPTPEPEAGAEKPDKPVKRVTKTVIYSPEEFEYLDAICQARIAAGITRDWNHFLRQMTDFAINGKYLGKAQFATPENSNPIYLKDAFCKPIK